MAVDRCLDYMQFTSQVQETYCREREFEPCSGVKFYTRGYRDKFGIRYYFGNPKSTKAFIVLSGSILENLRSLRNDYEIVNWALEAGAKFSRLDLAVTTWQTLEGDMVFMEDVKSWFKEGLCVGSLVKYGAMSISSCKINGEETLETVYIGDASKRGEIGIFRAYDKGVEMNIGAYLGTRLEIELKREKAHNAALRISQTNDIAGNFRAHFNVKHKDFEHIMDADAVKLVRGAAKERVEEKEAMQKRWNWLINQVAPSLRRAIAEDRRNGLSDANLSHFLTVSGIRDEQIEFAQNLSNFKLNQKLIKTDTLTWD